MIYLKLFWDFFKVSCFTFGGAYGAIPLIRDMVLGNGWIAEDQLAYMIAVSESTPGPIMVNLATYIGNTQAGFWGSLIATIAVVLPAYLVILLVMKTSMPVVMICCRSMELIRTMRQVMMSCLCMSTIVMGEAALILL